MEPTEGKLIYIVKITFYNDFAKQTITTRFATAARSYKEAMDDVINHYGDFGVESISIYCTEDRFLYLDEADAWAKDAERSFRKDVTEL